MEGTGRGREREEERISLHIHLDAALLSAALANDPSVLGKRLHIRLSTELVQEPRRCLDICEEKGDGSTREIAPHATGSSDWSRFASSPQHPTAFQRGLHPEPAFGSSSLRSGEPLVNLDAGAAWSRPIRDDCFEPSLASVGAPARPQPPW